MTCPRPGPKGALYLSAVIFPGTFDPITEGHLDVIRRSLKLNLGDKLIVLIAENEAKVTLFSLAERKSQIKEALAGLENVSVDSFKGLVADYAKTHGVKAIIRGTRNITDYMFEIEMAHYNSQICPGLETVFLPTKLEHTFLSSRAIKEIARNGGSIDGLTPGFIAAQMKERLEELKTNKI
ncbi:MAG: pantetheine-phosphate adenylyltransferase [Clostridiales bacterium]|nr:pantetheine-phosphate adenylyltransferase [Clostridiales bacterium]